MKLNLSPETDINLILAQWVERQPDQRLFAFLDNKGEVVEDLSYRDFANRVETLAAILEGTPELNPGDRVILSYQPGIEIVTALFACTRVGLIGVPTAPLNSFDFPTWCGRLDHILGDSGASAWLTCTRTRQLFDEGRYRFGADEIAPAIARLHALTLIDTSEVTTRSDAQTPHHNHPIAFLQYTSGSTSDPKGVLVSHKNLIANCRAVVDHERPIAVSWLPQHHDMGLIGYYVYIALSGGTTWGMSPRAFIQNPALWLEALTRYRATATSIPNFALELCLNERRVPKAKVDSYDLSNLSFFMVAAEPVQPETFDAFLRKFKPCGLKAHAFYAAFGLAEFTLAVTSYGRRSLTVDRRQLAQGRVKAIEDTSGVSHAIPIMSCGRALEGVDVRIVDPYTHIEVEPGQTGEVWAAGSSRSMGYWEKPDQSRLTFDATLVNALGISAQFLRTGDIGFIHEDELFICGRLKDMIIVRGQNIYSEDIEALARQTSPELRGNGVVAFTSEDGTGADVTVVAEVPRNREMPDQAHIVRAIREGLQVPVARVVFVPPRSVARTSSGKVRRSKTRALLDAGQLEVLVDTRHAIIANTAESEDDVYELALLKERYGLTGEEDFTLFDAGIDSLDLVVFLNWMKDALIERGVPDLAQKVNPRLLAIIPIRDLFGIVRLFENAPEAATNQLADFFADAYESKLAAERAQMEKDRSYEIAQPRIKTAAEQSLGALVTGGTGFLGPFLIDALLDQTSDDMTVLVRGRSQEDAKARLDKVFFENITDPERRATYEKRVGVLAGDLEKPKLGLEPDAWNRLASGVETVWHNGALVNYLLSYDHMRATNVEGTSAVLDLCFEGREKVLNYVSTTFIFGWASADFLYETDRNADMAKLDFGYSQSKWAAEQKVLSALEQGLNGRVFRPALITPSTSGLGGNLDITIRLLSFMVKHGIGVTAGNQVSFMPADITADNMVAIANQDSTIGQSFHVVRDDLETMAMITDIISKSQGSRFEMYDLPDFVPQVIKRCTRADPLFPLLDFLIGSIDNISAMEFKRYESSVYQEARDRSPKGRSDPPLDDVVGAILDFLALRNLT